MLLLLHGFSQTPMMWNEVLRRLSKDVRTPWIAGHGKVAAPVSFADEVQRLLSDGHVTHLVGYSLGARLALAMALLLPDLERLTLIGGSAGIEDANSRKKRMIWEQAQAAAILNKGVPDFLTEWDALPVLATFRRCERDSENAAARLEHTAVGLAAAMTGLGRGRMPSMWQQLRKLPASVDLLCGEHDAKHLSLNMRMQELFRDSSIHVIPNCGHNPVLEAAEEVATIIRG